MAKLVYSLLALTTAATAVQVGYVASVPTGYIYRSDNAGPANLIQLGAQQYDQPETFAASLHIPQPLPYVQPLPVAQPLQALEAYDLAPVPLPYIAAKPIVEVDDEDDESDEDSDEYLDGGDLIGHGHHGYAYEKGGGSGYGEENHAAHGEKGSKGYHSADHHAKGEAGSYGEEHEEGHHSEGKGGKSSHHDEADAHGTHYEASKGYKGGDHGHKAHHSKGEDITGYHKIFHKDEFKKDHDFYDVADNSGHFNKHGSQAAHHGSEEGGHKEGGHHDSASDKGEFGKVGFHAKGHYDDADSGHSAEEGHDSHYGHSKEYGKKGGDNHEKEYAFADDDDDDDEE